MAAVSTPSFGSGATNYQAYRVDLTTARGDANPLIIDDIPGRFLAVSAGDYFTLNVELQNTKGGGQQATAIDINSGATIEGIEFNRLVIKHAAYANRIITLFVSQARLAIDFGQSPPVEISGQNLPVYTAPGIGWSIPTPDNIGAIYHAATGPEYKIKPLFGAGELPQDFSINRSGVSNNVYIFGNTFNDINAVGQVEFHNDLDQNESAIIKCEPNQAIILRGYKVMVGSFVDTEQNNSAGISKISALVMKSYNSFNDAANDDGNYREYFFNEGFHSIVSSNGSDVAGGDNLSVITSIFDNLILFNKTVSDIYFRPQLFVTVFGGKRETGAISYRSSGSVAVVSGEFKIFDGVADLIPTPMPPEESPI